MKVEFGAIEETAIPGFKGGEGVTHARMFADGRNRIMRGRLEPGCSIGLHTHEGSCEMIFVLSGEGIHSDRENAFRSRRTGLAQKRKLRRREICRPRKGKSLFRGL